MRWRGKANAAFCLAIALVLIPFSGLSSGMEFAQMTDEQLLVLDDLLAEEMIARGLYVYVSLSGSKYHSKPTCSKMKAVMSVPMEDAEECGYEPCGKCCK